MINKNYKKNNLRKKIDFIKMEFFILKKSLLEYKANLYILILTQIIYLVTFYGFFIIFGNNFGSIIGWTTMDFILFLTLLDTIWCFAGVIVWHQNLFHRIKSGEINSILTKPLNPIFYFFFNYLSGMATVMIIINIPIIIFLIIYMNLSLYNLFISIPIVFLIFLLHIVYYAFLQSLNFIKLGIHDSLTSPIFWQVNSFVSNYPFQFFNKTNFKFLLMPWAPVFCGSLLIPIIRGYEIWNIELQITILMSLIILFFVLIIRNWHYGLKKYEAFG